MTTTRLGTSTDASFVVKLLPKTIGWYEIGGSMGMQFHLVRRPHWLARVLCRWLLDWYWKDA